MAKRTPFSGSNEPLNIFQDDYYEPTEAMTSHAPMPTVTKPARRPLSSPDSQLLFNPPAMNCAVFSPNKAQVLGPRLPLTKSSQPNRVHKPSMAPPSATHFQSTDDLQKKRPQLSKFKIGSQRPNLNESDLSHAAAEKENMASQFFPMIPELAFPTSDYHQKPNGKRGLMEAAPIISKEGPSAKRQRTDDQELPAHDAFPAIYDDGTKPPHSYAQLIGMAILRSPNRRLTLAQIYKWISDSFKFYNPNDAGWQNSIRHNLSLHKNFIKTERPKDDPGKGHYWTIEPGTEAQFLKEKTLRKPAQTAENLPVMSTRLEPSRMNHTTMQEPCLPTPAPPSQMSLPTLPESEVVAPEPSSDATILLSDGDDAEEVVKKQSDHDTLGSTLHSPLLGTLHSSPPISRHTKRGNGTPPSMRHQRGSSVSQSRKRNHGAMVDSGYISSVESSVPRPIERALQMTSEVDRPRKKKQRFGPSGRAEDEIARLRNSSPFSPTKARSKAPFEPVSSSPLRQVGETRLAQPLTPMVPAKLTQLPASVSPATNLALHRSLVRSMLSPARRVAESNDENAPLAWDSPIWMQNPFNETNFDDLIAGVSGDYDFFQDMTGAEDIAFGIASSVDNGSPLKKSVPRNRIERTVSTPQLTGSAKNKLLTSIPSLDCPIESPSKFLETPSKALEGLSSPSKYLPQSPIPNINNDNYPNKFNDLVDDMNEPDWSSTQFDMASFVPTADQGPDFSLDMLQGFQKIGSGTTASSQTASLVPKDKPSLGRTHSNIF
jgi:forkhead transcription factor HCM1